MVARGRNILTMLMTSQETLQLQALEFPARLEELRVPALDGAGIHLWHGSPQARRSLLPHLSALLSADEADRRARFHFEADRRDFAFARGMLRTLVAAYLKTDPREVRFRYSEYGKPSLAPAGAEPDLQFNLSHTQGAVLLAICRQRAIGVDVERVREDFSPQEIATRFFSLSEQQALMRLPKAEQRPAFFHCWSRKEAFLKARGHGLSFPLEQFDVSIGVDETEVRLTTRPDPAEAQRWQILQAPAPEGYVAAVAVARPSGLAERRAREVSRELCHL
jgi:4'-phosphopantetheinyl transferase